MQWRARRVCLHGESMQVRRGSTAAERLLRGQGKSRLTEVKFVTGATATTSLDRSVVETMAVVTTPRCSGYMHIIKPEDTCSREV